MNALMLACLAYGGDCFHQPQVVRNVYAPAAINYGVAQNVVHSGYAANTVYKAAYGYPYPTLATFAYTVEDPEKAALFRQNEEVLRQNAEMVKSLAEIAKAQQRQLERGGPPPSPVDEPMRQTVHPAVELLKKNCMGCHAAGKAKGGYVMPETFDAGQRLHVNEWVQSGEMPKEKPFTAEQKKIVADWAKITRDDLRTLAGAKKPEKAAAPK